VKNGLLESSLTATGRGDKEPVVTKCGVVYNRANVACNKPNRRVDLEVRFKSNADVSN
jgi:outer membrane protein OmpA-like peptidoglycan-associated protein